MMDSIDTVQNESIMDSISNDYSRYGIKDVPKYTRTTAFGKTKTFAGLFAKEWIFFGVSFINILTAMGLTLYRMIQVVNNTPESSDFTFALLLLVNAAFCLFYVIHGVLRERVYELYALIAAILVVVMYCILEYFVFNTSGQNTVKLVRVILACVMAPPNIVLAYIVSRNFGFLEFRIVGASEFLQKLYRQASIFSCLLKFEFQASCSVVILVLHDGTDISLFELIYLCTGIPFFILWALLGWGSLHRESKKGTVVFAIMGLIKPVYFLYRLFQDYIDLYSGSVIVEETIFYTRLAAAAIGLIVWFMLMVELVFVYSNFGKGLRERAKLIANEKTGLLTASRARWSAR